MLIYKWLNHFPWLSFQKNASGRLILWVWEPSCMFLDVNHLVNTKIIPQVGVFLESHNVLWLLVIPLTSIHWTFFSSAHSIDPGIAALKITNLSYLIIYFRRWSRDPALFYSHQEIRLYRQLWGRKLRWFDLERHEGRVRC